MVLQYVAGELTIVLNVAALPPSAGQVVDLGSPVIASLAVGDGRVDYYRKQGQGLLNILLTVGNTSMYLGPPGHHLMEAMKRACVHFGCEAHELLRAIIENAPELA